MTDNTHRRVAIWCAVSSPQQARIDKDSLPSQERDGRAWADENDYVVAAVYKVPGHTRKYVLYTDAAEAMPIYKRLIEDAEDGKFSALWCRARDRLGRTDALIATVEGLLAEHDVDVYSAFMPHSLDDASDASAIVLSGIERSLAQVEGVQRESRRLVGVRKRIADGLHPNRWPYGYAVVRDEAGHNVGATVVPEQAEAVALMTRLYLDGHSISEIVVRLRGSPYRAPTGGRWSLTTVQRILHYDVYAGYVSYGDIVSDEPSDRFEHIWSEDTYRAVLRERDRRRTFRGGKPPVSPLSGMVICAGCGWRMSACHNQHGTRYFRCNKHNNARLRGECHPNYIQLEEVERYVEDRLAALTTDEAIDRMLAADVPDAAQLARDLARAQKRLAALAEQEAALLLLQSQASDAGFARAMEMLVADRAAAEAALEAASAAAQSVPDLSAQRAALHRFRDLAAAGLKPGWLRLAGVRESRQALLQTGLRVWVKDGEITGWSFGA